MKKILSVLILVLAICLFGCNNITTSQNDSTRDEIGSSTVNNTEQNETSSEETTTFDTTDSTVTDEESSTTSESSSTTTSGRTPVNPVEDAGNYDAN